MTEAAYQRGARFLLNTQLEWIVAREPFSCLQPYLKATFLGPDQWISAAAMSRDGAGPSRRPVTIRPPRAGSPLPENPKPL